MRACCVCICVCVCVYLAVCTCAATDLPTPTISSVEPVSQSVVRVSLSVADSQCVDSYQVNTTQAGVAESITGLYSMRSSSIEVTDLDVCQNSYIFQGRVITAGGLLGELSPPYDFTANLSGTAH